MKGCDHYLVPAGITIAGDGNYMLIETCRFCRSWLRRPLYMDDEIDGEELV